MRQLEKAEKKQQGTPVSWNLKRGLRTPKNINIMKGPNIWIQESMQPANRFFYH